MREVTLVYIDGCPHWRLARRRLREALRALDAPEMLVAYRRVATPEEAAAIDFRGSPTILVDGRDPFGGDGVGMACRVYHTPDGLQGSPTVGQLQEALRG